MKRLALVALAACGRLNFDPHTDAGGTSADAAEPDVALPVCAAPPCFESIGADLYVEPDPLAPNYLVIGNTMYFAGIDATHGRELWKTDGTDAGTKLVADINPTGDSTPTMFVNVGGTLMFFADDGTHGLELWKSDGSSASMVVDLNPAGSGVAIHLRPTAVTGGIIFAADDGVHGREPWFSDGTTAAMIFDVEPGATGSNPYEMTALDATHVVMRTRTTTYGAELYSMTRFSSTFLLDAAPGAGDSLPEGWFHYFALMNGVVYYRGTDGTNGLELWRTDGTSAGTYMVADIQPGAGDGVYGNPWTTAIGTHVLFHGVGATTGQEPYVTDGTAAGTFALGDLNPTGDSIPVNSNYDFIEWGGHVYFRATDGVHGYELWQTDLTPASTMRVTDIAPGATGSVPNAPFVFAGSFYFAATDGTGQQLWTFDGSQAQLAHAFASGDSWPYFLGSAGPIAILGVDDANAVTHLWRMF